MHGRHPASGWQVEEEAIDAMSSGDTPVLPDHLEPFDHGFVIILYRRNKLKPRPN